MEPADIEVGRIKFQVQTKPNNDFANLLTRDTEINRITGKTIQTGRLYKNGKEVAIVTRLGECSKIEVVNQKF